MARRHRLSKPTSSSSSKTLSLQELEDALDTDYEPSSATESEEDSDVEEQAKEVKSSAVARQRKKWRTCTPEKRTRAMGRGAKPITRRMKRTTRAKDLERKRDSISSCYDLLTD